MFTVVHRAIRRDGGHLAAAVSGLRVGDTTRARALRRWYGAFHAEVDRHHALEDHLWFPVLAERVPTFVEHRDRTEREHHLVDDALRKVAAALDRLVDSDASAGAKAAAHEAACELSSILDVHLAFEDADILPLFFRHVTSDEYAELEARARRLLEVRRLPFTVPWIMAATTPAERTLILGSAPLALKLVWCATRRHHARLTARALGPATRGVA
jgi:hypothetical protein